MTPTNRCSPSNMFMNQNTLLVLNVFDSHKSWHVEFLILILISLHFWFGPADSAMVESQFWTYNI